ncbi:glycosyltransferase family 2 protein [Chryseobacterium turcicum]|uniref:Glycosyltransferase n=1 Tax=Chryseobacterium turcicum TaxID=2898076 RepID=A0A9Q3V7Y1_9FLAO|nr:glycosyltransferase family 2 protein [Chryseobacterium turcicum]MCD1118975.1 glycosyltransferase [Chryseobacterium turcicum]
MPKVSICIPTYNNLEAFERCFESVLMQNFQDYEVVITDDSSNNDIELYLHKHSHLKNISYYKNSTALGSPENWNEAMRKASGDYIKILHHDDFFTYNHSLQIFVDLLDKNPESNFAFVASRNFDLKKNTVLSYNKPSSSKIEEIKKNPLILLNGNFIGAPSATIFRKTISSIFDNNTIWLVDIDFYIQILLGNNNLIYSEIDAISIGSSSTQITKSVESNKAINVFEHFYLLSKWNVKKIKNSDFDHSTYLLLKKFNIKSSKEIRSLNYKGSLPKDINRSFIKLYSEKIRIFLKRKYKN